MKRELAILSAFLLLSVTACSQPGPAPGPGPGMMGGYGMGHGMMMGPGMMGGYGGTPPDLSPEQRTQLAEIQQEFRRKQWDVMQRLGRPLGQERTDVG